MGARKDNAANAADLKAVADKFSAAGIVWDRRNTVPAQKSFAVEIRLDVLDRLKLGMLVAVSQQTPEEWLSLMLLGTIERVADKMLKEEAAAKFFADATRAVLASIVYVNGEARLAFVPAVMA